MALSNFCVRNNHHKDDAGFTAIDTFDSPADIILDKFHFQAMVKMVINRWLPIKSNA